ncbi:MAG: translation elongation factor Ts [Clostridiales bacterium]|nr:translation elongation factor Ts [Clostridiales bacterium]
MAVVTAQMVKELRELSGAGMMDCKKALNEAEGDIKRATEILREKGLSALAKKSGRIAAEGVVGSLISGDNKIGALVEINSETDFVAKNADFQAYVQQVLGQVVKSDSEDVEGLLKEDWMFESGLTVEQALSQKIAVIGENLKIRRFVKFNNEGGKYIASYIHMGGKVGVLLELLTDKVDANVEEAAKNICMQIAAMSPKFVNQSEISAEYLEKEKEILKAQALNEGKPINIVEKMIEGRLQKELKEICINEQIYVKDDEGKKSVAGYLKDISKLVGADVTISKFVRYAAGEGIEKKEENFADEVNKAMNVD